MKILEQITWAEFFVAIGILTMIYYLLIAIILKINLKDIVGGNLATGRQTDYDGSGDDYEDNEENGVLSEAMEREQELMAELEIVVEDVRREILEAGENMTKEELSNRFVSRVASYGGLHRPAYRYALNNSIIKQAKEICGVDYSEDELEAVWESLPR